MLAIILVQLHGVRVHILENNEGLLDRDYATNAPFYEKFGIKSGKATPQDVSDLANPDVQIVYTLKAGINKHFLRGMVSGSLELSKTVLIVDEVDDLIVNERPNAHYVKKDVERSPMLQKAYEVLKSGSREQPSDVDEEQWKYAEVQKKL